MIGVSLFVEGSAFITGSATGASRLAGTNTIEAEAEAYPAEGLAARGCSRS